MSYISERKVKGKKYYYLEESFLQAGKLEKLSIYLGPNAISNETLLKALEKLKKKCSLKDHEVFAPPLTEFISNRTASNLEKSKKVYSHFLETARVRQKNAYFRSLQIKFEQSFTDNAPSTFSKLDFASCMKKYKKFISKKEKISQELIMDLQKALVKDNTGFQTPQTAGLLKLLLNWLEEKENLIHPAELASKFLGKFYSLHAFAKGNEIISLLLMNYILESKNFPFLINPIKRKINYEKALASAEKENFWLLTNFISKEIVKQTKRNFTD